MQIRAGATLSTSINDIVQLSVVCLHTCHSATLLLALKSYILNAVRTVCLDIMGPISRRAVLIGIFLYVLPIDTRKRKAIPMRIKVIWLLNNAWLHTLALTFRVKPCFGQVYSFIGYSLLSNLHTFRLIPVMSVRNRKTY